MAEIFEDLDLTERSTNQETPLELFWDLPKEIGAGSIQKTRLGTGFEIVITDFRLREPLVIDRESRSSVIGLGFAISGSIRNRMQYASDDWFSDSGQTSLYYRPASNIWGKAATKDPVITIHLQMAPHFFNTLLERELDRIPDDFGDIASGSPSGTYRYTDVITPLMQAVLHQIMHCPYHGLTRQLYLEGKAYELIACKLEQSLSSNKGFQKTFALRPDDIERVHHAREIICRDLESPPRLLELARMVGLPHPKLNFCFRELYGTTIFEYLRELRLNQAKSLLDEGRMNVTEVAYSVGYSSLSHFARSFKRYHGITPGNYLRKAFSRW